MQFPRYTNTGKSVLSTTSLHPAIIEADCDVSACRIHFIDYSPKTY